MKITKDRLCYSCGHTLSKDTDYEVKNLILDSNFNGMYELVCPHCGKVFWQYPWEVYEEFSS